MRLLLIRHGETPWNRERRVQGCRSDTELSQRGREQAEKIALLLRKQRVDALYSSSLRRAVDTAKVIAQACGLEVQVAYDLREIDAGELEGLSQEELRKRYEEFWKEWSQSDPCFPLPGGESLEGLQRRTWGEIERIMERHPKETVAVVGHLLANLAIICRALGLDLSHLGRLRQDSGAINVLEITRQGSSLLQFNDTCHLVAV
jgi:broad specificity phosphatase PhoE